MKLEEVWRKFKGTVGGTDVSTSGYAPQYTVAAGALQLPAAGVKGRFGYVTDGAGGLAWGATISGNSTVTYLVWDNGTNWTVVGK
jgi:hypothetical protein